MKTNEVRIGGYINAETANAILLEPEDSSLEEAWIPLSQVSEITRRLDGKVSVVMTRWIATQKGWL